MRDLFESIYRTHRQGLYTLALSITRRPDRAEDAVQEGFARLFRLRAEPAGDPVAYAFAAVRNAAVDQQRKLGRSTEAVSGDAIFLGKPADDAGPEESTLAAERQAAVRAALAELPEAQRLPLILKIYGGLTFEQIAEAMDLPLGTVASRYRRSLEKLRPRLEKFVAPET